MSTVAPAMVAPSASAGEAASAAPGLFCAYCGKQFTRKEHLERHLPNHTQVKPHRCTHCQLSFSRRDLLVRHYTTYHEKQNDNEPVAGRLATVAGRSPIACQNCATAKTGCDKRAPCTRCTEKGLQCEARFARRSGKTAARQAQARSDLQGQMSASPGPMSHPASPLVATATPVACKTERPKSPARTCMSPDGLPPQMASPHMGIASANFPSPHAHLGALDGFGTAGDMPAFPDYGASAHWTAFDYFPELGSFGDDMADHHNLMNGLNGGAGDHHDLMRGLNEESDLSGTPQLTPGSYDASPHTRDTSICSPREADAFMMPVDHIIPEFDEVKAAEDGWNIARCNPPIKMADCPSTSLVHLESLETMCRNEDSWANLETYIQRVDWNAADLASVAPLSSRTRERMLVITQTFLHKALSNHRDNHRARGRGRGSIAGTRSPRDSSPDDDLSFIVLPPSEILEYFLRSYVRSLSLYYPLIVAGKVDPNDMMQSTQTSTLLMLLMIAQGAAATPVTEARYLSAGLTETCRISLGHTQNLELKKDPLTLRCALLFIVLGVWSGDKWLMDYAMGQRSMYMDMVKDAGMLNPQPAGPTTAENKESMWQDWVEREGQNRLVYNYVMLDQELCIFYDTGPRFSINQLECPLPASEHLWMAHNADEWLAVQADFGLVDATQKLAISPPASSSLRQLFDDFVNDTLGPQQHNLSAQQLRLLLYPLQTLISDQRHLVRSLTNGTNGMMRNELQAAAEHQMTQLEQLLAKWYLLARNQPSYDENCAVTRCNMALFYLISMHSAVDFSEIEKFARREKFDGSDTELWMSKKRRLDSRALALYNAGQVLRWLRAMPRDRRPAWWSLAMYRVTLVIWADSMLRLDPHFQQLNKPTGAGPLIPIDMAPVVDNDTLFKCLKGEFGTPVLTLPDGVQVNMDKPLVVLLYGVKGIEEGASTRLGDGIVRKLVKLADIWSTATGPVSR
ncbi:hypothetical protein QBC39DRAFT_326842 [Podospora conica]|nr:hypothetical protein QBC39DRAFT_326842 [Schizothecium conicum]